MAAGVRVGYTGVVNRARHGWRGLASAGLAVGVALAFALAALTPGASQAQDDPSHYTPAPPPPPAGPPPAQPTPPAAQPTPPTPGQPASPPAAGQPTAPPGPGQPTDPAAGGPAQPVDSATPPPALADPAVPPPPAPATARYPAASAFDSEAGDEALETEQLHIPSRIATRIRVLDRDLTALSVRGGSHIVDGVLSILTGGLVVALGVVIDNAALAPYFYVYGGAGIVRGVIDLSVTPDASDAAIAYGHMSMGTVDEVKERLRFGEHSLESIADRSRLARILDSSISIAAGLAFIPLYAPNGFGELDTLDYFVLIGAGISLVSGVINLLTRSDAERRWSAYSELRERLRRERGPRRRSPAPAAAPPATAD